MEERKNTHKNWTTNCDDRKKGEQVRKEWKSFHRVNFSPKSCVWVVWKNFNFRSFVTWEFLISPEIWLPVITGRSHISALSNIIDKVLSSILKCGRISLTSPDLMMNLCRKRSDEFTWTRTSFNSNTLTSHHIIHRINPFSHMLTSHKVLINLDLFTPRSNRKLSRMRIDQNLAVMYKKVSSFNHHPL